MRETHQDLAEFVWLTRIIHKREEDIVILSAAKNLGYLGATEILRYAQDDTYE